MAGNNRELQLCRERLDRKQDQVVELEQRNRELVDERSQARSAADVAIAERERRGERIAQLERDAEESIALEVATLHDRLILRRFQMFPVEWTTSPQLVEWTGLEVGDVDVALGRLQGAGIIQLSDLEPDSTIRWTLTTEARREAIEIYPSLVGLDSSSSPDPDLVTRLRVRIETLEEDLAEEQRIHQLDVDELKAKVPTAADEHHRVNEQRHREALAKAYKQTSDSLLEVLRRLVEAYEIVVDVSAEDSHLGISELEQAKREYATEQGKAWLEVDLGEVETDPANRAIARDRELLGIGGSFIARASKLRLDVGPDDRPPADGVGVYSGRTTEEGMLFERLPVSAADAIAFARGTSKAIADQLAKCQEARVSAEERAEELQAWVDEHVPAIDTLLEHLAGDEPAWWVKAAGALEQLGKARSSVLIVPPRRPQAEDLADADGLGRQ